MLYIGALSIKQARPCVGIHITSHTHNNNKSTRGCNYKKKIENFCRVESHPVSIYS